MTATLLENKTKLIKKAGIDLIAKNIELKVKSLSNTYIWLSAEAGISKDTINSLVNKYNLNPNPKIIIQIESALGICLTEFHEDLENSDLVIKENEIKVAGSELISSTLTFQMIIDHISRPEMSKRLVSRSRVSLASLIAEH